MTTLIKNTFLFTAAVLTLAMISCKDAKKDHSETEINSFSGTWIAKDFVDDIIVNNAIKTIENGVTEIVVPENVKDSILFLNEDLESAKYLATIQNDTLVNHLYETKTQKAVIQNGNLILLPLDERYDSQEYIKADASLLKKAKDANLSVLRILINKTLADNVYLNNSSKEIKFTEDGKVSGIANFKNYYISINGDGANVENSTAITFTTADGSSKNLGIEFQKNKTELYDLVLLTKPDEKPFYKKGKLLYSLKIANSKK